MSGSRRRARAVLAALGVLALVETVAAARAYRSAIAPEHWEGVRAAIDAAPQEPVWLATEWLGPRARMFLPAIASVDAAARPDLRGAARFSVLGLSRAWSEELERDLEDMPAPALVQERSFGPLVLATYEQPAAGEVVGSLLADPTRLSVHVDGARCKGQGRMWRCNLGRARPITAEIDYRPRRCIAIEADDGVPVRIDWPSVQTGDTLRGHVGFHDFNRRLRSDAPVELAVLVDGSVRARLVATDAQGWVPFAVKTDGGVHDVAIEVVVGARGTWGAGGYDPGQAHAPCVELRALVEGGA